MRSARLAITSVEKFAEGGWITLVVTGLVLMSISTYIAYKRGYPKHERVSFSDALKLTFVCLPALFMPIANGVAGYLGGILIATAFNVVARWTGGVEITVEDID